MTGLAGCLRNLRSPSGMPAHVGGELPLDKTYAAAPALGEAAASAEAAADFVDLAAGPALARAFLRLRYATRRLCFSALLYCLLINLYFINAFLLFAAL